MEGHHVPQIINLNVRRRHVDQEHDHDEWDIPWFLVTWLLPGVVLIGQVIVMAMILRHSVPFGGLVERLQNASKATHNPTIAAHSTQDETRARSEVPITATPSIGNIGTLTVLPITITATPSIKNTEIPTVYPIAIPSTVSASPVPFIASTTELVVARAAGVILPECDFQLLYIGDSLLNPPLNITASLDLATWQVVARQLAELQHLLATHRGAIIARHGVREFEQFRADLENTIERPLRLACSTVRRLQVGLLEFNDLFEANVNSEETHDYNHDSKNNDKNDEDDDDTRAILAAMLHAIEIDVHEAIIGASTTRLLPGWARHDAPELRSDRCPRRDCFKIRETALDIVALKIPRKVLGAVRKLRREVLSSGHPEKHASFTVKCTPPAAASESSRDGDLRVPVATTPKMDLVSVALTVLLVLWLTYWFRRLGWGIIGRR
ncbi:hypothetical protein F4777DRAFT_565008 [Nemania sp. FL0916]|nr:hypothetical protein F4777DRAFT_565008 [Nemania sp. FL0916]